MRNDLFGIIINIMSFYRSDSINYYKLVLPRESAWEIMNSLGSSDLMQDSNGLFILCLRLHLLYPNRSLRRLNDVKMH